MHTYILTVYVHMYVWWPEVNVGYLYYCFPPSLLKLSLTEHRAHQSIGLAGQQMLGICLFFPFLSPRVTDMCYHAWIFKVGIGDPNSGLLPHAGTLVMSLDITRLCTSSPWHEDGFSDSKFTGETFQVKVLSHRACLWAWLQETKGRDSLWPVPGLAVHLGAMSVYWGKI